MERNGGNYMIFATSSSNKNYDELTGSYPKNWSENKWNNENII